MFDFWETLLKLATSREYNLPKTSSNQQDRAEEMLEDWEDGDNDPSGSDTAPILWGYDL